MYSLRVNKTVVIKGVDKVTAAIVWNLEDYLKKVSKQLEENEVYMEVPNNPSAFVSTILKQLEKIRKRGNLSQSNSIIF